jgi:hypothetical protein
MHISKRIALVLVGVFCTALFLAVTTTVNAATVGRDAAYKAATDTDPHLPLTPYQQQMLALKKQAVANVLSGTASAATVSASLNAAGSTVTPSAVIGGSASASASTSLTADQNPQKTSY